MNSPFQELVHDHEAIIFALGVLDRFGAEAAAGRLVDREDARALVDFLREFADTCHHGKEEGSLFPALIRAGLPAKGGPVAVMLEEHEVGRGNWKRMDIALRSADNTAFAVAVAAYSEFLRQHIEKENTVLFPMGEDLLNDETLASLSLAFAEHERTVMGEGRHAELHRFLDTMGKKYGS